MKRNRYSADEETLRNLLRTFRIDVGMRQEDLAKKMNAHQSFVSKYESGERLLTFIETINICRALGINPSVLLQEHTINHET